MIDARQYLSWQPGPPGLPATCRVPRPVPASGPPAHRFLGARRTLVASADSSPAAPRCSSLPCGRAEGRARPHAPLREPLAHLSEASAELARPQRPERADASESLSVLHPCVNSDEHDAKHGARSVYAQQARNERSEWRGASSSARSTGKSSEVM